MSNASVAHGRLAVEHGALSKSSADKAKLMSSFDQENVDLLEIARQEFNRNKKIVITSAPLMTQDVSYNDVHCSIGKRRCVVNPEAPITEGYV